LRAGQAAGDRQAGAGARTRGARGGSGRGSGTADGMPPLPAPGARRTDPRTAYFARTEIVPHERAAGRVSADSLAAYPPGIPNVVPGEEITAETIAFLRAVAVSPIGYVRGSLTPDVHRFRVLAEPSGRRSGPSVLSDGAHGTG